MATLAALLAYLSTLFIVYLFFSEAAPVLGAQAWVMMLLFSAPFVLLLVLLYTRRDKEWPVMSLSFFLFWLFWNSCALIAWPGIFHNLVLKSASGQPVSNLRSVRENLSSYLQFSEIVPAAFSVVQPVMPALKLPLTPHKPSSEVRVSTFANIQDSGQWLYVADSSAPVVLMDCTHLDYKGKAWSSY